MSEPTAEFLYIGGIKEQGVMYQLHNLIYAEKEKRCGDRTFLEKLLHYNEGTFQQLVHGDEMAHAAGQNEAVENFMGTEVFMQPVKYRELAGINDTANGINDATG